jgi:hypothetical protein
VELGLSSTHPRKKEAGGDRLTSSGSQIVGQTDWEDNKEERKRGNQMRLMNESFMGE